MQRWNMKPPYGQVILTALSFQSDPITRMQVCGTILCLPGEADCRQARAVTHTETI